MGDGVQVEYTQAFVRELRALPPDQRARVVRRVDVLQRKGWGTSAQARDVVRLSPHIWELRVLGTGPAYRVLFFAIPGEPDRIVVLTRCVRKGLMKKTAVMASEIARAESRRREWLAQHERTR